MITYGMIYATAVGLPILLAAIVGSAVLRRYGRPERGVWLVALGLALALPAIALLIPSGGTSGTSIPLPETGVIGLPAVVAIPAAPSGPGLSQMLGVLWLLASAALVLRWVVAAYRLAMVSRFWRREIVDGVAAWLTPDLGPAVAGVLNPRILVPSWLRSLPQRQRSLVLLHEQEHVIAWDPLLMAVSRVARILTPWNPVVWLLTSRLVRALELDCDRRVLRRRPDIEAYGTTLLAVSARDSGRLVAVAAFAESEAPLRTRILAMTTPPRTVSVLAILTSLVFGVILLIGVFEIPVPSVSIQLTVDPAQAPAPPVVVADRDEAAETSPAPIVAPGPVVPRILSRDELTRGMVEAGGDQEDPTEPEVRPRPTENSVSAEPTFTPFTVAPSISNRAEVVRAMNDEYPPLLREAGIGGTVRIYFFINEDGVAEDVRIDKTSGHPALDDAALSVASVYRFNAALNRNQRVPVWVSFPITFQVR